MNTLIGVGPVDFDHVFSHYLNDYKSENTGNAKYRDKMKRRLELRNKINQGISYNYSEKSCHSAFFHKIKEIPLWAVFEVINLGNLEYSCSA